MMVCKKNAYRGQRICWMAKVLALGFALASQAQATESGIKQFPEIEYASPDQSVWTTKTKENGEPDNPLSSVAAAMFGQAGIPWHGRSYPASRLFTYLQNGTTQFSMLVKVPALQDCCLFSKKAIATAEIRAYRRAGTPPIRTKEDLVGKRIITIRGYSYGGLINFLADERNRVTNNVTQAHSSAFRMLESGRADYVIDYGGPASEVLSAEPVDGVNFDVLSRQDIHLVLSKNYPDSQNVMGRLEAIVATLDVEGMLEQGATDGRKNHRQKLPASPARPRSVR